jgi:hypothetical protein
MDIVNTPSNGLFLTEIMIAGVRIGDYDDTKCGDMDQADTRADHVRPMATVL